MDYERLKENLRTEVFTNPTPFSEDGEEVLYDELATNVEWMTDRGAKVVIPCGNTGEYYSLSMNERAEVVTTTAEAAGDATVGRGFVGFDPDIAVSGLNPHASDGGLLGDEDDTEIRPAIAVACERGISVNDQESPDTVYVQAVRG